MRERPAAQVRLARHEGRRGVPRGWTSVRTASSRYSGRRRPPLASTSPRASSTTELPPIAAAISRATSSRPPPCRTSRSRRSLTAMPRESTSYCSLTSRLKAASVIAMKGVSYGTSKTGNVGRPGLGEDRLRDLRVIEAGAESQAGNARVGEPADERPLLLGVLQRDAGGEQELAAREPGRGIEQLGDVDPANLALGRPVPSRQNLEAELGGEALDREHQRPTRRDDSSSTGRRTSTISSNCSVSAISGGENWMTGSPRSSARQISPRR